MCGMSSVSICLNPPPGDDLEPLQSWAQRQMPELDRITRNSAVMGGKPCVRGMRVTVGMIVGLVAAGHGFGEILPPIRTLRKRISVTHWLTPHGPALAYAAWRVEEIEVPLPAA